MVNTAFYDIETKTVADDHPNKWQDIPNFGMSLAVIWDNKTRRFRYFKDAALLYSQLLGFERIVSYNGLRFDNPIIAHDAGESVAPLDAISFDMLADLTKRLGYRIKLNQLAEATLGIGKSASGTEAVDWWKAAQELRKVLVDDDTSALSRALRLGISSLMWRLQYYCQTDVRILRDVFRYGCTKGHVLYEYRGIPYKVPVEWPTDWYEELKNATG